MQRSTELRGAHCSFPARDLVRHDDEAAEAPDQVTTAILSTKLRDHVIPGQEVLVAKSDDPRQPKALAHLNARATFGMPPSRSSGALPPASPGKLP
jgi:hypothetical protein